MPEPTARDNPALQSLDETLRAEGPEALARELVARVEKEGTPRELLDALLLQARIELGLPVISNASLSTLPDKTREAYEDRYVAALRRVGERLLATGQIVAAWPYFRIIGEKEQVARALEACQPGAGEDELSALIDVAFQQGALPSKGFGWIVEHYGVCSAITAFEHLPQDEPLRSECTGRLVRALHEHLVANLRAEIELQGQEGEPPLPTGASIPRLLEGREGLLDDDNYHVDLSHLASITRLSPLLSNPEEIAIAVELTEYGRKLSSRHRYEGEPPFQDIYEDHGIYLKALLGQDVAQAVAHFSAKLQPVDSNDSVGTSFPAQILVRLLERVGYLDQAVQVASEYLAEVPESALACTPLPELCQRANALDRLVEVAARRGDLIQYAAALVESAGRSRAAATLKTGLEKEPS